MRSGQLKWLAVAALLGCVATWPSAVRAQHSERMWRLGFLDMAGDEPRELLNEMRRLGYFNGQNLTIDHRRILPTTDKKRIHELAADLVRARVDLILTRGIAASRAAKRATQTIPIVFFPLDRPVEGGLVSSLRRPGGNATGLAWNRDDILEILKEMIPKVSRVLYLHNPISPDPNWLGPRRKSGGTWFVRDSRKALLQKIELLPVAIRLPQVDAVFEDLPAEADALFIRADVTHFASSFCTLATQRRLPAVSHSQGATAAGCLMSLGPHRRTVGERLAVYVDKVLKGDKPADLAVGLLSELVINLKTAKALGITVAPSLLERADELID